MNENVARLVASVSRISAFAVSELLNGDTRALKRSAEILRVLGREIEEELAESARAGA